MSISLKISNKDENNMPGIQIKVPKSDYGLQPRIVVFGVGGAGCNAVNNMMLANLGGVDFWVANTDAQALDNSLVHNKIQIGLTCTKGLGAGSHPEVGRAAAEESLSEIKSAIAGCHMLFITAGMGGGTGTGAAPVIAKIAKDEGILVVGVVTKPFHFEGARRMNIADIGLEEMGRCVDTLIVIPNQNLFRVVNEKTTFIDAFKMADNVLHSGVRSITDLITIPGLINLDFADIRTVMQGMGKAMMGTGEGEGENRAIKAAESAISNPLLDNSSMKGAKGVLINITGGNDMTLHEVDEAANRIRDEVEPGANIIFGSAFNSDIQGKIRVSVVATGIDSDLDNFQAILNNSVTPDYDSKVQANVNFFNLNDNSVALELSDEENSAFIPSQPQNPDYEERIMKHEAKDEDDIGHKSNSLFSKVVSQLKDDKLQINIESKKQTSNLFDIPAFLRKKKSDKK
jgi:cell division protein FtsZ